VALIQPGWTGPLVNPDGSLSKPLVDLLRALALGTASAATATDLSAVVDRLDALEGGSSDVSLYGTNGITVYGSAESGYEITLTGGGDISPLVGQIFGS
jgi:hypothetical protein